MLLQVVNPKLFELSKTNSHGNNRNSRYGNRGNGGNNFNRGNNDRRAFGNNGNRSNGFGNGNNGNDNGFKRNDGGGSRFSNNDGGSRFANNDARPRFSNNDGGYPANNMNGGGVGGGGLSRFSGSANANAIPGPLSNSSNSGARYGNNSDSRYGNNGTNSGAVREGGSRFSAPTTQTASRFSNNDSYKPPSTGDWVQGSASKPFKPNSYDSKVKPPMNSSSSSMNYPPPYNNYGSDGAMSSFAYPPPSIP